MKQSGRRKRSERTWSSAQAAMAEWSIRIRHTPLMEERLSENGRETPMPISPCGVRGWKYDFSEFCTFTCITLQYDRNTLTAQGRYPASRRNESPKDPISESFQPYPVTSGSMPLRCRWPGCGILWFQNTSCRPRRRSSVSAMSWSSAASSSASYVTENRRNAPASSHGTVQIECSVIRY